MESEEKAAAKGLWQQQRRETKIKENGK